MPLNERHRTIPNLLASGLLCTMCFIPLVPTGAQAIGFYGNQSDIQWKTAGTEHFQYIYPTEYSEHAAAVSAYAEAVYDSVVSRYRIDLPGRVSVTLNNALYSNGSAVPSENGIHLWLTNWDFKVRSSHGWISDVVTHEFSHLVSIESGSKILPNIYGFQAGYSDYYNERTTTDFLSLFPFTLQPLWLAEGTAQYESSRMGFDSWDTHRDMLLRVAALNDDLLSLEYMHDFSSNSLYAELGPYNQGFSLVRYISKHYGESAVPKIWSEMSRIHRVTLDAAIKKVLGISEQELYDAWKKEITEQYQAQKDSLGTLVEGTKLTEDAFWQDFPIVAGKYVYGISNFGGDWFDGGIFKMPLDKTKDERQETKDTTEIVDGVEIGKISIEDSSIIDITEYAKSGFKAKKAWFDKGIDVYEDSLRGPILAYISYQNRDRKGHAHFDVVVSDTNKSQVSVTYLTDAVYPAIDKQGTTVAFARRENASTRFLLSKVPFPKDFDDYTTEDPVDIFVPDAKYRYYNIYSPKFSPDGKRIAFSFFDDTTRGIAIIDSDGKNHKIVSNANYDERDVEWLDNDKIIFASNRNGIFNLFEKSLSTNAERPLTNVVGGAFTPVLSGDTIFFTQYDKDGFSLYKIAYKNNAASAPAATKDSIVVTFRDSVVKVADTTWSTCPEVKDSTQADSAKCVPQATVATRDSTIKIEVRDTVKVAVASGDSTAKDAPIVLHGSLPKRIQKPLELENREFAGAEKTYRPIPFQPLFIPMLMFSENAPDLTVFGEGELKTKAGLAMILTDPLKKNTVQLSLLLELGNGYDYINGDGINPRQEKEFFASWQNTSTPLDLGLAYSYANYTSKDTVRNDDVRSNNGDSLSLSHYAMSLQSVTGLAGYSIFKSIDTLQFALSYGWSDFNFYDMDEYEDSFSWTYQKQIKAILGFGLYGDHEEEGTGISGQGNGVFAYYQYTNSDLYRPGTFSESFYVTESGFAKPKYRNFNINEVGLNLYGSMQLPVVGTRVAAGGKTSVIAKWNTDAKQDTLDSYYYNPIFLEGYPFLRSSESYTLAGTKTAMAELHLLQPIYDDWRKSFWIFETRDFYVDLFAQIGSAWNTKWFDMDKFKDHDFWDRSVGLSFRMSNKIFYNVPLDISLTLARGLSRIGEGENGERYTSRKLNPIDMPIIPESIAPTRIKLNIGMGFTNTWQ